MGWVFFSIDMQNLKQEGELLQHQLKRKGETLQGEKCKFSPSAKQREKQPPPCTFFLPSLNLQQYVARGTAAASWAMRSIGTAEFAFKDLFFLIQ